MSLSNAALSGPRRHPVTRHSPKLCLYRPIAHGRCIDVRARTAIGRKQMSGLFRPPHAFAKHDDFEINGTGSTNKVTREPAHEHRDNPGNCRTSSVLLRDDHLILFVIDLVLALHARWKRWRKHRQTLRALADLDERQLRDIGVTRDNDLSDTPFI